MRKPIIAAVLGASLTVWIAGQATQAFAEEEIPTETVVGAALAEVAASKPVQPGSMGNVSANGDVAAPTLLSDEAGATFQVGNDTVKIALDSDSSDAAERAGDMTTFGGVAKDADAAVRSTDSGVQLLAVMRTADAPTSQRYVLDLPADVRIAPVGEGYALLKGEKQLVGVIDAPWAVDANGTELPTHYEVEGTTLVQYTDTTNAEFPVVADPKLTVGLGVYLNMWGDELRKLGAAAVAVVGTGVAVSCTVISKLPNQILRTIATLACGAGAVNLPKVFAAAKKIWSTGSIDATACYQIKIIPTGTSWKKVGKGNCR